jgi:DNA transformation protein and related proteins
MLIMDDLNTLPNMGKDTIRRLKEVGINSAEELKAVGSEQAFMRLRAIDPGACLSLLCGLEGAVQGTRWHQLPTERKEELMHFIRMLK